MHSADTFMQTILHRFQGVANILYIHVFVKDFSLNVQVAYVSGWLLKLVNLSSHLKLKIQLFLSIQCHWGPKQLDSKPHYLCGKTWWLFITVKKSKNKYLLLCLNEEKKLLTWGWVNEFSFLLWTVLLKIYKYKMNVPRRAIIIIIL